MTKDSKITWSSTLSNGTRPVAITEFKHLSAWSHAILALDVVKNSVVDGLDDVYYSNIEAREGYLSTW
jgi:glutathione S-transferase